MQKKRFLFFVYLGEGRPKEASQWHELDYVFRQWEGYAPNGRTTKGMGKGNWMGYGWENDEIMMTMKNGLFRRTSARKYDVET